MGVHRWTRAYIGTLRLVPVGRGRRKLPTHATRSPGRRADPAAPPSPWPTRARFVRSIPEYIGGEIEKACHGTYPLQNVHIRKVKMLKKPKFDITKLLEIHGDNGLAPVGQDKGDKVKVADLGEGAEQKEVIGA